MSSYEAGYQAGSIIMFAVLATALVVLVRRVRRSAPAPYATASGSALAGERPPVAAKRRTTDIVAICVIGVMLVVGVLNFAVQHAAADDAWSTAGT